VIRAFFTLLVCIIGAFYHREGAMGKMGTLLMQDMDFCHEFHKLLRRDEIKPYS